jgi:hypothetical protein
MECSLSDSAPLAITATEVFECIACGGLAAPNDVIYLLTILTAGFPYSCRSRNESDRKGASDSFSNSKPFEYASRRRHR